MPVYAAGPRSHLFSGTFEQSYVAHAISYAACIGPERHLCHKPAEQRKAGGDICRSEVVLVALGAALVVFRERLEGDVL